MGIGEAIAVALAGKGMNVALLARSAVKFAKNRVPWHLLKQNRTSWRL